MKKILFVCVVGMLISLFVIKMKVYVIFIGEEIEIEVLLVLEVSSVVDKMDIVMFGF